MLGRYKGGTQSLVPDDETYDRLLHPWQRELEAQRRESREAIARCVNRCHLTPGVSPACYLGHLGHFLGHLVSKVGRWSSLQILGVA
jgi:hypothetical protein